MKINSVFDKKFKKYGQILDGYDFTDFIGVFEKNTPMPEEGFIYVASNLKLEEVPIFNELKNRGYGGMPMQLGYCNGRNTKLNCLEYHRCSEICIMANATILLLGCQSDIVDRIYDTSKVEAFLIPSGTGVELFATTLHYAPCSAKLGQGYRVANGLPRGTNTERPFGVGHMGEDKLMVACNKWLLAHKESEEAVHGAYVGLKGKNIDIKDDIR